MDIKWQRRLINWIPFRFIRKRLRFKYFYGDRIFSSWLKACVMKHAGMMRCKDEIEEICVGSSHGFDGYLADDRSFNLADTSCDLYYATRIACHWLDAGCKKLKRIILFYDVFSPAHNLSKSSHSFIGIGMEAVYHIPPRGEFGPSFIKDASIEDVKKIFADRWRSVDVPSGYRGNNAPPPKSGDFTSRNLSHKKLNQKPDTETIWVKALYEAAKAKSVEVVVVIAPCREDYRADVGGTEELLFSNVRSLAASLGIKLLSYYASSDFEWADFCDPDHLNVQGAAKLTKMIHRDCGA